jgi:hypothetical protein
MPIQHTVFFINNLNEKVSALTEEPFLTKIFWQKVRCIFILVFKSVFTFIKVLIALHFTDWHTTLYQVQFRRHFLLIIRQFFC